MQSHHLQLFKNRISVSLYVLISWTFLFQFGVFLLRDHIFSPVYSSEIEY